MTSKAWINKDLNSMFKEAVYCNDCLTKKLTHKNIIGLPQPRWIGPFYQGEKIRILVILLNPGSGKGYKEYNQREETELLQYKSGKASIEDYLLFQINDMNTWGHGKFRRFYGELLGLDFDRIAFSNIAWCATEDNSYPRKMLNYCYEKHTKKVIEIINPHIIILSGTNAWRFETTLGKDYRILQMWHYANRKSSIENKNHASIVKNKLKHIIADLNSR